MSHPPPPLPSDGQLLDGARDGLSGAWDELVRRHGHAISGVAKTKRRFGVRQAVERSVESLRVIEGDSPVGDAPGGVGPGIRSVRARLLAELTGMTIGPGTTIDPLVAELELLGDDDRMSVNLDDLASVARAFAALPEPWQTALWHRVVELQTAAEYAPLLGRAANDAAAVVHRADAGLFEAYLLDQRSHSDVAPECEAIIPLLGGALRSTLSAHEQRVVAAHLGESNDAVPVSASCDACARRVAVSRNLSLLLPAAIVPELTGLSVERYRAAAGVRPAAAAAVPNERRRRFAFSAIFAALLLTAGATLFFTRDGLDQLDADPPAETDVVDSTSTSLDPTPPTLAPDPTTAPTTTELELRPTGTGPANTVSIIFDEPAAIGLVQTSADLSAALSSPGPVYAGGTGTIDVTLTNSTDSIVEIGASVQVPAGVIFDGLIDGPADCVVPEDNSARCDVTIPAGTTERVTVRFRLENSIVGRFVVESNLAAVDGDFPIAAIHRLVHSSVDEGQVLTLGNTLMTCVETEPGCIDARNGDGDVLNRWDYPARFVGGDLGPGWFNSSSANLDLGAGTVDAAYLFWSGDLNERDVVIPDDGRSERVLIVPPGSLEVFDVEAGRVRRGDVDATQYFGSADVTDIVRQFGAGDYIVGNVQSAEVQGSYAGWSLVVVTRDDTMPRRSNVVFSPFSWFSPDDTYAFELAVPVGSGRRAHLGVVAFEGERGFVPERLMIGGRVVGDSAFDSTISGQRIPNYNNNFGVDIDAYDLVIDAPSGTLPIEATSDFDGIRLGVLTLAVDVE